MKKALPLLLSLCLLLTACSSLSPAEYLSVTPHAGSGTQAENGDAVTAENYLSLKNAILGFVKEGRTEGSIRITSYDGDVENDLAAAAYEVSKQDPLGAYAVDYMTHECSRIVSYYEIRVNITFRRTAAEIAAIESVSSPLALQTRLEEALASYADRLTLRISSYRDLDIAAMVEAYCAANPDAVMEIPTVSVSAYPSTGTVRIVEIDFHYTQPAEELVRKELAVAESVDAAAEYIRYRSTDRDKAALLFTYLMERFTYETGATVTPLYDALCSGIADPKGLSQAWQLICNRAGVDCRTVAGNRDGKPYTWNIVAVDGTYRHLDLASCVLDTGVLNLRTDEEMTGYYWDAEAYPACVSAPEMTEE